MTPIFGVNKSPMEAAMQITRRSAVSGIIRTKDINVTREQLAAWDKGALAQDVFSNISKDDREFIMTGITPAEWEGLFKDG